MSGQSGWEESWDFDFHRADGSLGGYVRLGLWPQQRLSWFWAALVGDDRPLVTVVDHELPLSRPPGLDLRAEGLWTSITCETPLEHWSVGLEAFGVALDDPTEVYRRGRGDPTPLGLDLEWETTGPAVDQPHPEGYYHPCVVHGEVLVGPEVIAFDGWGGCSHSWGDRRWWDATWCTTSGRFDDSSAWHGSAVGGFGRIGDDGLARPGRLTLLPEPGEVAVDPRYHAPVQVVAPDGRTSRVARSLCRYVASDGRRGVGWTEWNQPMAAPSS